LCDDLCDDFSCAISATFLCRDTSRATGHRAPCGRGTVQSAARGWQRQTRHCALLLCAAVQGAGVRVCVFLGVYVCAFVYT
jgi:hypothetical protein